MPSRRPTLPNPPKKSAPKKAAAPKAKAKAVAKPKAPAKLKPAKAAAPKKAAVPKAAPKSATLKAPPKSAAPKAAAKPKPPASRAHEKLLKAVLQQLDDDKAEAVVTIELDGRSSLADALVIASGRSSRHVAAMAEHLSETLKAGGFGRAALEGESAGDWTIVDCGDVIVHLFRPEVRAFYDLEGMWKDAKPSKPAA